MFASYGQSPTPERVALYAETVGNLPMSAVETGIRDAMREVGEFPPGPGTVRRCALAAARMRPGDPVELPREGGFRLGAGAQPVGALLSGLERRVAPNYRNVIDRARELRHEHHLPPTLDARLWSLGEAERELGYREPPHSCNCYPTRCGRQLEASLERVRAEAGERLRLARHLRVVS
jgi:hypothetical protein